MNTMIPTTNTDNLSLIYENNQNMDELFKIAGLHTDGQNTEKCLVKIHGYISPEQLNHYQILVFGKPVNPSNDPQFGPYCKVIFEFNHLNNSGKISMKVFVNNGRKNVFYESPREYFYVNKECFGMEEDGEDDDDDEYFRTYYHFDNRSDNVTGEGDVMMYKCKFIRGEIYQPDE